MAPNALTFVGFIRPRTADGETGGADLERDGAVADFDMVSLREAAIGCEPLMGRGTADGRNVHVNDDRRDADEHLGLDGPGNQPGGGTAGNMPN